MRLPRQAVDVIEHGEGPRPGSRDNGLRAASYVALGDLDPRIADALLTALREEGIAAYAAPTPGSRGGYLEVRLPAQPTDRVYVDESRAEHATELLAAENAAPESVAADIDAEAAWQQVLASLQSTATNASRPWPASEEVPESTVSADDAIPELPDEHFVPPPAPPLPTLRPVTVASLLAIIAGIVILVTGVDGGDLGWLGVAAIVGGAISLVWHVRDDPPTDSGWDDGAVV